LNFSGNSNSINENVHSNPRKKIICTYHRPKRVFRQLDEEVGTKLLLAALSMSAAPIVKAAKLACGDTNLQRRAILAIGGMLGNQIMQ